MDLERLNLLLSVFHASLNVPNTANIQHEIQDEITSINEDLTRVPKPDPCLLEPQASKDGSGGTQDVSEESLFQARRV